VGGRKKTIFNRIGKVADESTVERENSILTTEIENNDPIKYPIITRRAPQKFTDWDAPENDEGQVVTSFLLDSEDNVGRKRKNSEGSHEVEKDIKWSRRLKRPRMHMVADEIESKLSAKTRLYKGIQRRIDRPEVHKEHGSDRIEIFEEDEDENEGFYRIEQSRRTEPILGDKNESLTMSVKINNRSNQKDFSGVRMSERFPARKGISASLRQRLGDFGNKATSHEQSRDNFQAKVRDTRKETSKKQNSLSKGYNSGDSLEMDEGDDLRGELDGHHAANMVIQVTQSPKRNERNDQMQDNTGSDENMEDDRRQESHIASVVAKIKTEKKDNIGFVGDSKERDHRATTTQKHKERDQRRDREKDDRRKREQINREKEIVEREKLRRERHKQIDDRKSQQYRTKSDGRLDHSSTRFSRENRREERSRDKNSDRIRERKERPVRIKKEKLSDDEGKKKRRSADTSSSDDSSSSSSSSSDESSSSSSSSDSDSSESSSSSSESSSDESKPKRSDGPVRKKQKLATKPVSKRSSAFGKSSIGGSKISSKRGIEEKRRAGKGSKDFSKSRSKHDNKSDNSGLRDKLKDYLNKAKERRRREKGGTSD